MKKYKNLVIGGIQQKVFNLVLVTILLLVAAYTAVILYQTSSLKTLTGETNQRQKEAIAEISGTTMDAVVADSLVSKTEMAALAYHLEREVIGLGGGKQDQYAAVFGGFNSLKIDRNGVNVLPARISPDIIYELQCRSVMCFTGTTHDSAAIIDTQVKSYKEGKNDLALDHSKDIAVRLRSALRHGEIDVVGNLLAESWEYKKKFSDKVSNPVLDNFYNTAIKAGAIGGKVSGAGGGGFMYFVTDYDKKSNVSKALAKAGATISEFNFEPEGVVSWRSKA